MKGNATVEATAIYAKSRENKGMPATSYRPLGSTRLTTSTLGFGCYRVDDNAEHAAALERALRQGINLIDTSTNYTDGASESCVGRVLEKLHSAGAVRRDEVILVSKVGYVQGQNLELAMHRDQEGKPYGDMVRYMEGCWHCIHPDFVHEQLTRSLSRLKQERIDVYLLHNPEYFFSDAKKQTKRPALEELRNLFYDRIRRAFIQLEAEAKSGRLLYYGVSSNTFGAPEDAIETTSLSRMLAIAREVGGDTHRFRVVQLPMNLFESGPSLETNNDGRSALEVAAAEGLAVLVNRPLNAMVSNQLVRLADFKTESVSGNHLDRIGRVADLEAEYVQAVAPLIHVDPGSTPATDFFRWGKELSNPDLEGLSAEHWNQIEMQMVRPQLSYLVQQLDGHLKDDAMEAWRQWRNRYLPEIEKLLRGLRAACSRESQKTSAKVAQKLDPALPPMLHTESLSRKSLATLVNTPGVTCVLNGMRRDEYVDDSLGAMKFAPFEVKTDLYRAFRR